MRNAILEIRDLSMHFGGLAAISDLNMDVFESEILGLIGPNGSGKSTLFNVITGFYPPTKGKITYKGEVISGLKPSMIAQMGIVRTFQQTTLFMGSTVFENVLAGCHISCKVGALKEFLHTRSAINADRHAGKVVMEILEFMGISSLKDERAMNLSHGHQRVLGVCMALAANPKLLLLDEPVTGMNPVESQKMVSLTSRIRDKGITVVIVEHNMKAVMNLCDRVTVLSYGRKIAEGLPSEIRDNKDVIETYLGKKE
jgi:branched-chain amino acid transport system ATP-binding protein